MSVSEMNATVRKIVKRPEGFLLTFNGTMPLQLGGEPHLHWPKLADLVATLRRRGYEIHKDGTCTPVPEKKGKKA